MAASARVRREMDFLEESRDELGRRHEGRYLVIRGRKVLGDFGSEEEAYREGVRLCGKSPFLLAHLAGGEAHAWVPLLVEVGPDAAEGDEEYVPSPSWRRGKLLHNPIVWTSTPPPPGGGSRGPVRVKE